MAIMSDGLDFAVKVCKALGIDPDLTRRIIIDLDVRNHGMVRVYTEGYASDTAWNIDWDRGLDGASIIKAEQCDS